MSIKQFPPDNPMVSLTTGVSGDLPFANLAQGSALSVLGVTGNATADNASIAAGSDHQVVRRSGTAVAFGAVNLAQSNAVTGVLAMANGGSAFSERVAFAARNSVDDTGVTGNGTDATVDFDTELYDTGGDFAGDTFTAPTAGKYFLSTKVRIFGITTAADQVIVRIVTTTRTYTKAETNTNNFGGTMDVGLAVLADLGASDTCTVEVSVSGEASDVCDINSGTGGQTLFMGYGPLIA